MSEDDLPDNLPRSPSGRVPKWVLDQARGEAPTELIPFRAPEPLPSYLPPTPERAQRPRQWLSLLVVVALVLGMIGYSFSHLSTSKPAVKAKPTPSATTSTIAAPPPGYEESGHPLGQPLPVVDLSTQYRFLHHQADPAVPVTWSPCRPIHYVVRPTNQPVEGPRVLAEAFTQLSEATGLQFVNDGFTQEGPDTDRSPYQKERYGDRWAPVLITWANDTEVPDFGTDVVGEASPIAVTARSGATVYVSGEVNLDAEALTTIARTTGEQAARAIALHELGHLVGLDHVKDTSQVMNPRQEPNGPVNYQAGDLTGLTRLGSGPCRPDV